MTEPASPVTATNRPPPNHLRVAIFCASIAVGMVGMSYAAVPLYQMFCQVTGFGGTTQVALAPSDKVLDQTILMRFDGNVAKGLPWKFEPIERTVDLKIGENRLVYYRATNISDTETTGTASFNVTPPSAGIHFNKIECFCFTEQTLKPGESIEMPVSFFVDAALVDDPDANKITQLTLSYTFYPTTPTRKTTSAAGAGQKGGATRGG